MSYRDAVHNKAAQPGKDAIQMTTAAGSGQPCSPLSLGPLVGHLM